MDLGAVSPRELGVQTEPANEMQEAMLLDQAISAATEVLHYISGAGLTPQAVMRAKVTGARPFRKLVAKRCQGKPEEARFQCRKHQSETLLCAMVKVAGFKLKVQVELEATATGKTCKLSGEEGDLPAKI